MSPAVDLRASVKALSRDSYEFPLKTKKRLCVGYRLRVRLLKEKITACPNVALRRAGDWGEVVVDHCPQSHLPVDYILSELIVLSSTPEDRAHFEDLFDPEVLAHLVSPGVYLIRNHKKHVLYAFGVG